MCRCSLTSQLACCDSGGSAIACVHRFGRQQHEAVGSLSAVSCGCRRLRVKRPPWQACPAAASWRIQQL